MSLINTWKDQVWSVRFSQDVTHLPVPEKYDQRGIKVNVHHIPPVQRVPQHETCRGSSAAAGVTGGLYAKLILMLQKNRPLMLQLNRFLVCFVLNPATTAS